MSEKFDIYSKIFFRDVENFVRHLCVLVLRHQMQVSNYFVNSFYSVLKKEEEILCPPFLCSVQFLGCREKRRVCALVPALEGGCTVLCTYV